MKLKILHFFDFVAGSDTFNYKKPNILHLKNLNKSCNFKKNETIFIGDTEVDSKTAENYNIKFVLIKNGYTTLRTKQINYNFCISNYDELRSILKEKI